MAWVQQPASLWVETTLPFTASFTETTVSSVVVTAEAKAPALDPHYAWLPVFSVLIHVESPSVNDIHRAGAMVLLDVSVNGVVIPDVASGRKYNGPNYRFRPAFPPNPAYNYPLPADVDNFYTYMITGGVNSDGYLPDGTAVSGYDPGSFDDVLRFPISTGNGDLTLLDSQFDLLNLIMKPAGWAARWFLQGFAALGLFKASTRPTLRLVARDQDALGSTFVVTESKLWFIPYLKTTGTIAADPSPMGLLYLEDL